MQRLRVEHDSQTSAIDKFYKFVNVNDNENGSSTSSSGERNSSSAIGTNGKGRAGAHPSCSAPVDIAGMVAGSCDQTPAGQSCTYNCTFPLTPVGVGPLSNGTLFCNATGMWVEHDSYCELSFWMVS